MLMYSALILAAGNEKPMNSNVPRVLHQIAYKSIGEWILNSVSDATFKALVVNSNAEVIKDHFGNEITYIKQDSQNMSDNLAQAKSFLEKSNCVLILNATTPLIKKETINAAYSFHMQSGNFVTVLTSKSKVDSGIYFFDTNFLVSALSIMEKSSTNDVIKNLLSKGEKVGTYIVENDREIFSINDRVQLALAEKFMREEITTFHMKQGVTFISPETAYISGDAVIGSDTIIMPNTIIKGNTSIGGSCLIGPNTTIDCSKISNSVEIANSVVLESEVGENTHVGPFAYIRPNSKIGKNIKVGDFVEIKNSNIGDGTMLSHLTYVGDADVGEKVNFGCGTIIVNYDGVEKHRTTIGDNAFIGCNTNLVSPVNIGKSTFIAAGSTITEDVPDKAFAIARSRQTTKTNWKKK